MIPTPTHSKNKDTNSQSSFEYDREWALEVRGLTTSFQTRQGLVDAIRNVSYRVRRGETLGVVGESGCGKSITSFSIMGLIEGSGRIRQGEILFKNQDLLKKSEKELSSIRGHQMAMIFQEPMTALNPVLSIGEQIDESVMQHLGLSKKEARERSVEMLSLVGIPSPRERADTYPHQLSGGMRQRVMIAMSLSCNPSFLIADEPTTALDVTIQAQILELLQNLQEKFQMSIQFITHDLGVISEISDRVMVMYGGHVCEIAPASEIFDSPRHPYTEALIAARPKLGSRVEK
ncbi:MAG: ABC transporter ATP-binding protein, partial [Bdellovibrio sp.]